MSPYAAVVRVLVTTEIAAPPARVWRALTVPAEVAAWDGVEPLDVPEDYPQPGQHARWRSWFGPVGLTLHDRISVIDDERRMVAEIDLAFVHVDEEYRLLAGPDGTTTTLVTDDAVRSHVPGLGWLAIRLAQADVASSMGRLRQHCEGPSH